MISLHLCSAISALKRKAQQISSVDIVFYSFKVFSIFQKFKTVFTLDNNESATNRSNCKDRFQAHDNV